MKQRRYYLDTSVIGGYFDPEFRDPTRVLFEEIRCGRAVGVVSEIVLRELEGAPEPVKNLMDFTNLSQWEIIQETEESLALAEAYMKAEIVSRRFFDDCRHVAVATIEDVSVLLVWNCRHIVHYDKIRMFNAVNLIQGFGSLEIRTPAEVIKYDE